MAFIKKIKRKWQGREKWSVTAVTQGTPVSTKELCQYIADSSTASASDVYATLPRPRGCSRYLVASDL